MNKIYFIGAAKNMLFKCRKLHVWFKFLLAVKTLTLSRFYGLESRRLSGSSYNATKPFSVPRGRPSRQAGMRNVLGVSETRHSRDNGFRELAYPIEEATSLKDPRVRRKLRYLHWKVWTQFGLKASFRCLRTHSMLLHHFLFLANVRKIILKLFQVICLWLFSHILK